jgi:hypothetical protein
LPGLLRHPGALSHSLFKKKLPRPGEAVTAFIQSYFSEFRKLVILKFDKMLTNVQPMKIVQKDSSKPKMSLK